ncbi:MAG: winged helix-turn-helix domain-containing protein, partial [Candidatus Colwellbacteria bacterium]|nr:winged helix-turn-helix domain-containing protein [Candidatus Colwellbacteria bacterium]
ANDAKSKLLPCFEWTFELIKNEGGIVAEHDFLERHGKDKKGALHLILYLDKGFLRGAGDDVFHHHWYLDEEVHKRALQELENLHTQLTKQGKLLSADKAMEFLTHPHFLKISKIVGLSPLGAYGFVYWPEVAPKGVKDKAYIVLKKEGKPLHFMKITAKINELGLGKRPALKQTVHNELIKDKRFVLVGRGMYGLKEWGFREGTVKDILASLFREVQKPLSKDEIISRVLRERFVQRNTILLNLANGGDFVQLRDGRYTLKSK